MQINLIEKSPLKNKRFRVHMADGSYYDFGLLNGSTYIDHHDVNKRLNYWKRHYSNEKEQFLIDELIPSPALFSAYLLWGYFKTLEENKNYLNKLFSKIK